MPLATEGGSNIPSGFGDRSINTTCFPARFRSLMRPSSPTTSAASAALSTVALAHPPVPGPCAQSSPRITRRALGSLDFRQVLAGRFDALAGDVDLEGRQTAVGRNEQSGFSRIGQQLREQRGVHLSVRVPEQDHIRIRGVSRRKFIRHAREAPSRIIGRSGTGNWCPLPDRRRPPPGSAARQSTRSDQDDRSNHSTAALAPAIHRTVRIGSVERQRTFDHLPKSTAQASIAANATAVSPGRRSRTGRTRQTRESANATGKANKETSPVNLNGGTSSTRFTAGSGPRPAQMIIEIPSMAGKPPA